MMFMYSKSGKKINCDQSQVSTLLSHGYSFKPAIKEGLKNESSKENSKNEAKNSTLEQTKTTENSKSTTTKSPSIEKAKVK